MTYKRWNEQRLDLVGEGVGEASGTEAEARGEADNVYEKEDHVEHEEKQANAGDPVGAIRNCSDVSVDNRYDD